MINHVEVPSGWALRAIGDIVEDGVQQGPPGPEGVPYIDIGSIDRTTKRIGETQTVTTGTAPTRARQWVKEGDVLVSMTRPNLNAVAMVPHQLDGAVASTGFDVLRAIGIEPAWLFARVRSVEFVSDICKDLQGVVYPAVRPRDIRGHQFPVPPAPEQRRVLGVLDSYISRLNEATTLLERVQRNLKRYRASVLKAAIEGRLVSTEAELARAEKREYEPASVLLQRILVERRQRWEKEGRRGKYEEPEPPDTKGLRDLPEGWCWSTVGAITLDGPQNGLYVPKSEYGWGTPILRIDDYQIGWNRSRDELQMVNISAEDAARYGLRAGDMVINRVNSPSHLGKSLVVMERHVPAVFESNMMRLGLASDVEVSFVHHYLSSVDGKKRLTSDAKWAVNQASINQGDVARTPVPLPPAREQARIVTEIERLFSSVDEGAAVVSLNQTRCTRLRQSILKWAFEGKLVDQDPSDEPASALLARIRAERPSDPPKKVRRGP